MNQPNNSVEEFVQSVTHDQSEYIHDQLKYWGIQQPRFFEFLKANHGKVTSKFRTATHFQDARDLLVELEIAYRLLNNPTFQLTYEPFGKKGSDYRVISEADVFHVEVKRVRQSDAMSKYEHCFNELYLALRAIPSQLIVTLNWNVMNPDPEFASDFSDRLSLIRNECLQLVDKCKPTIAPNETKEYSLASFPKATLSISHIPEKQISFGTSLSAFHHPLLFTQKESFKFSDLLLSSVRQFQENTSNVLAIRLHSDTHFEQELPMAYHAIERHVQDGNEAFFQHNQRFTGIADFEDQFGKLSAVVVITGRTFSLDDRTLNLVWANPRAILSANQSHLNYFGNM